MQAESITNKTLREQAYEIIKGYILKNAILPGDDLSIGHLANTLGISPTPVREALRMLRSDGLIEYESHKTCQVLPIEEGDVLQCYEVRRLIEPYVANKVPAVSVTDTQLMKKLKTIHETAQKILELPEAEVDLEDYLVIDFDLHKIFLQAAGDTLLKEVLKFVGDRSLRIRTYSETISQKITSAKGQKIHETTEEHKEIIECLLKGDSTLAQKKVLEHLIKAESRTLATIRMKDKIDRAANY